VWKKVEASEFDLTDGIASLDVEVIKVLGLRESENYYVSIKYNSSKLFRTKNVKSKTPIFNETFHIPFDRKKPNEIIEFKIGLKKKLKQNVTICNNKDTTIYNLIQKVLHSPQQTPQQQQQQKMNHDNFGTSTLCIQLVTNKNLTIQLQLKCKINYVSSSMFVFSFCFAFVSSIFVFVYFLYCTMFYFLLFLNAKSANSP
jgi:hypothetical protein